MYSFIILLCSVISTSLTCSFLNDFIFKLKSFKISDIFFSYLIEIFWCVIEYQVTLNFSIHTSFLGECHFWAPFKSQGEPPREFKLARFFLLLSSTIWNYFTQTQFGASRLPSHKIKRVPKLFAANFMRSSQVTTRRAVYIILGGRFQMVWAEKLEWQVYQTTKHTLLHGPHMEVCEK